MDDVWERSIPFFELNLEQVTALCQEHDCQVHVTSATPVYIGCRNSNYVVDTNHGKMLLRICPERDNSYKLERALDSVLDPDIRRPKLLFASVNNYTGRPCLLYEYVDAVSLQTAISGGRRPTAEMVTQVAHYAAKIHNSLAYVEIGLMDGSLTIATKLPPFHTWYELFMGENTQSRLGPDIIRRLRLLLAENREMLDEIDRHYCLVHGDYRPANMLIDERGTITIVDWELASAGHPLADVGQFFRYTRCFDQTHVCVFGAAYNGVARNRLPDNWFQLAKLRDLVNLLQMMGGRQEQPRKQQDLREVILDTLDIFGC